MAAYRADIEIGVRGADRLKELQDRITRLGRSIDDVNVKTLIERSAVQSIESYSLAVSKASSNLREVTIQLDAAGKASGNYADAISQYVTALGQSNAAQKLHNDLIADEIELRRKQKLAASGIQEKTQYAGQIGPGQASPIGALVGQTSPVAERIQRTLQGRKDEITLQQALLRLEEKSAAELNKKVQSQEALVQGTQEVVALLNQEAARRQTLAGKSGSVAQGPLAGPGAMGFPVALPLTQAEQKVLDINAKKQEILQRMVTTRQQLVGLAGNLQRLELNSAVAIADADRSQQQLNDAKEESVRLAEKELAIAKQGALLAGKFSPIGGAENIPGSPAAIAAAKKRRREALSNAVIGGAFPLLFGQGTGAAIGGGLGGAAGGMMGGQFGFGLSLVGTALGQAFDNAIQSAKDLGKALEKPVENFDLLKEKALVSSRALEKTIDTLIQQGDTATASALIQQDLNTRLGSTTVKSLTDLAAASDEFSRATAASNTQLQVFLANMIGLTPILKGLASGARINELQVRAQTTIGELQKQGKGTEAAKLQEVFGRTRFSNITPEEYAKQLNDALQKAESQLKPVAVKLTLKQQQESFLQALTGELSALDIAKPFTDSIKQTAREQQSLDKQRADIVRSYEENIASIRKNVEDEIARRRFSVLEKENQLLDLQGQNRLKQLEIANREAVAAAGAGQVDEIAGVSKEVAQLVATFTEQQLSAEEQAAKIKRDAALDARKFDYEALAFKVRVESEVAKLNINTARQVADINARVTQANQDADDRRFKLEKAIAIIKIRQASEDLRVQQVGAQKALEQAQQSGDMGNVRYFQSLLDVYTAQRSAINEAYTQLNSMTAPPQLRGVGAVGGASVSTAALDTVVAAERDAIAAIVDESLKGIDIVKQGATQALTIGLASVADKIDKSLLTIQDQTAKAEKDRLRRIDLINAGLEESVAQRVIELEQAKQLALAQYDAAIAQLDSKIVTGEVTAEVDKQNAFYRDQIRLLMQRKAVIGSGFGGFDPTTGAGSGVIGQAAQGTSTVKQLQDAATNVRSELNTLLNPVNQITAAAEGIGSAFSESFKGITSGAMTAQEALAKFFQSVADQFLNMAAQIIAKWITLTILNSIVRLFPSNPAGAAAPMQGLQWDQSTLDFTPVQARAVGGPVSSGSPYMVGERGPELFVPGRSGTIVPNNKLGGDNVNVVVNVDAKGTNVQGNDQTGNQLGRVISAAVQQELIKQKRPGGLLA